MTAENYERVFGHDNIPHAIADRLESLAGRLLALEGLMFRGEPGVTRLDQIEKRLDAFSDRLDRVTELFNDHEQQIRGNAGDIENLVRTSHLATRLGHLFHPQVQQDEDLFEDVAEQLAASTVTTDELKRRILYETDNRPTRLQSLIHALTGYVSWRLW